MLTVIHLFSPLTVWDLQAGGSTRCDYHCTSLAHAYTHTYRAHLLVFGIMLHMFNIKGGFELQAGSGWWWGWGCSRPGQWTVGILWSPTDLPSPGIPTSLSDTQDKSSSIFLSAHPFKSSYWSVEMSWKLNYLLKCSLKMLSITYCAR